MRRVIGVGNPWRRDDGVGHAVLRRLAGRLPKAVELVESGGGAAELLEAWRDASSVVVVDAAAGRAPGKIHRFDAAAPLPAVVGSHSTHGLGVAEAVELGRLLGRLPPRLVVYGVEGEDFRPGEGLTPAVASAVEEVTRRIADELTAGTTGS